MEDPSANGLRLGSDDMRRTCVVDCCDRTPRSSRAELCEGHYYQQRRGRPLTPLRPHIEGTTCAIDGCEKTRRGKFCSMHEARLKRHGDPSTVITPSERAMPSGPDHPNWIDEPDYFVWHQRLRKIKGSASIHRCTRCDGPAQHWAYVGDAQGPLAYETNPDAYAPMCHPCHKAFDTERRDWKVQQPARRGADWLDRGIEMYESGRSCAQIGAEVGRNSTSVWRLLVKNGVKMRPRR